MKHHITIPQEEINNLSNEELARLCNIEYMKTICGQEVHVLQRTSFKNEKYLKHATCERCKSYYNYM